MGRSLQVSKACFRIILTPLSNRPIEVDLRRVHSVSMIDTLAARCQMMKQSALGHDVSDDSWREYFVKFLEIFLFIT